MSLVNQTLAQIVKPRILPPIQDWAEENIKLDIGVESSPRYVSEKTPWHASVFEWLEDRETEQVFLLCPAQSGKSTLMIVYLAYVIANDPSPVMVCFPNELEAKAFTFQRVKPTIEKSFPEYGKQPDNKWLSDYGATVNGSNLWIAWSTSEARCRSWPKRVVIADETSLYKVHPSFLLERTKTFTHPKVIFSTTPTTDKEASYLMATEEFQLHRFIQPCPHCMMPQALEFENLVFDHCRNEDQSWNYTKLETEVKYKCQHCSKLIDQSQRLWMLSEGRAEIAAPEMLERSSKRKSLRITCLDVPKLTWGDCVIKFLESKSNPKTLEVFKTQWLAQPWTEYSEGLRPNRLKGRIIDKMPFGNVPHDCSYLLAGADVQDKAVYYVVRSFDQDGKSQLVHCGKIEGEGPSSNLAKLHADVLTKDWICEGTGEIINISACAVDSGDNTSTVYDYCRQHRHLAFPLKGSGRNAQAITYSRIDRFPDGKPLPGALTLYTINSEQYAKKIINNYLLSLEEKGAWSLPQGVPEAYLDHLECWTIVKKNGQTEIKEKRENHYFDCEKYCLAIYDVMKPQLTINKRIKQMQTAKPVMPQWGMAAAPIRRNY